ncbi:MAG: hypothetical protein ABWJ42_06260 [Sulfolobales archaeon]
MSSLDDLERYYGIIEWAEDLDSVSGLKRFREAYDSFSRLVDHVWFRDLFSSRSFLRVVDVCGGVGVGGIALAKVLSERGFSYELVINDLRVSALERARVYSRRFLGREAIVIRDDALNLYKHLSGADIALIYGLSTPHFDAYQIIYLMAGLSKLLGERGVLVVEEIDRIWSLYQQKEFREVALESSESGRVVLSGHLDYDPLRGVFRRVFIDINTMSRVELDFRLWDLAGIASVAWAFFREIDYVERGSRYRGFILARGSREIDPEQYSIKPFTREII